MIHVGVQASVASKDAIVWVIYLHELNMLKQFTLGQEISCAPNPAVCIAKQPQLYWQAPSAKNKHFWANILCL